MATARFRTLLVLVASAAAAVTGGAAAAPSLPNGTYACVLDGKPLGEIKIEDGSFYGLAKGGAFGSGKRFITMDPDRIEWLGNMGDLTQAGYRVDKTEIRSAGGKPAFDLTLLLPDQSRFVKATCSP